jgi:Transposase IS4
MFISLVGLLRQFFNATNFSRLFANKMNFKLRVCQIGALAGWSRVNFYYQVTVMRLLYSPHVVYEKSPRRPYDYFMAVFPTDQLMRKVRLTNEKLNLKKRPCTTTAELLKFIGVLILGTKFEFGSRADL